MVKIVQAKSITDEQALGAVRVTQGMHGVPTWSTIWDVQEALCAFPAKVVRAKLRALIRKGKLKGCTCGCRGDFEFPAPAEKEVSHG